MDEKTESLRDIFVSVTDEEAVTEHQAESRGALTDERGVEELEAAIAELRDREGFATDLDDGELCRLVVAFFDGADDAALAEELGVDAATAYRARMDLHLHTEADLAPPFDAAAARRRLEAGEDPAAVAEALDADAEAVERYALALRSRRRSLRTNERYRSRYEEVLADGDISRRLAREVREDGLEDATEGMETDVRF